MENLMQRHSIKSVMLAAMLATTLCVAGCSPERPPSREQLNEQADAKRQIDPAKGTAAVPIAGPTNDDAVLVIAACGPAASDQVLTINDKTENGSVRRMVYTGGRGIALDFL